MAEAEVLSNYEAIKVVPAAAAVMGEMQNYGTVWGFQLEDITSAEVALNEERTLIIEAELVKVVKNTGETWTPGEIIYWDNTNSYFTDTDTGSLPPVGIVHEAAASADTVGVINFNGRQ